MRTTSTGSRASASTSDASEPTNSQVSSSPWPCNHCQTCSKVDGSPVVSRATGMRACESAQRNPARPGSSPPAPDRPLVPIGRYRVMPRWLPCRWRDTPMGDSMAATSPASLLEEKIQDRTATIGVVGLGYVGLPLLRAFFRAGFPVLGFDVDDDKIAMLEKGESYLKHLGEDFVAELASSDKFAATSDPQRLADA
ncbi:MAG TPA: hypothetical protein ENI87_04630, partial [bacterium]|nr:hypothetical protein [bacterium]